MQATPNAPAQTPPTPTATSTATATPTPTAQAGQEPETLAQQGEANSKPVFAAGSASRSVDENAAIGASAGDPVTADDADDDRLTYSLSGSDAFAIDSGSGQITVRAALDYERQASYSLTVSVSDGRNAAGGADDSVDDTIVVSVSVINVDEAGIVLMDAERDPPQAGSELRARVADPDGGVRDAAWTWQRSADKLTWEDAAGGSGDTYALTDDDAGHYLRASAAYTDAHGSGKSAVSAAVGPVEATVTLQEPEPQPQQARATDIMTATANSTQVRLTWSNAYCDAERARAGCYYDYRYRRSGVSWVKAANPDYARAQSLTGHTVTGLSRGTTYEFEVRRITVASEELRTTKEILAWLRATATTRTEIPPTLDSIAVTSSPPAGQNGFYRAGDVITVTVAFSKALVVTGTPELKIKVGNAEKPASCALKAGDNTRLVCSYAVVSGDLDTDGIEVEKGKLSGTIRDSVTNDADLAYTAITTQSGHKVDTVRPSFTGYGKSSDAGSDKTYKIGDIIEWLVGFSEAVALTGTPKLRFKVGSAEKEASCALKTDLSNSLIVCSYQVASGDEDTDGISIDRAQMEQPKIYDGSVTDLAGNVPEVHRTTIGDDAYHKVDGIAPAAPAGLSAKGNNGQIRLSWNDPNDAGIAKYQYRHLNSNAGRYGAWQDMGGSSASTTGHTVTVVPIHVYTFQIRAVDGASNAGPPSAAVIPDSLWVILDRTGTQVMLTLPNGYCTDSAGCYYEYRYRRSGTRWLEGTWYAKTQTVTAQTVTAQTVTGLTPGTTYEFEVRRIVNDPEDSEILVWLKATVTTTEPIDGLTATATDSRAKLTWTNPASCAAPACGYQYRYRSSGGEWSAWADTQSLTAQTVTGLHSVTQYEFALRRVRGGVTTVEGTVTVTAKMGAVDLAASAADTRVALTWTNPGHCGASTCGYQYRYRSSGGAWSAWADTQSLTAQTVTGLTFGATYEFAVRRVRGGVTRAEGAVAATSTGSPAPQTVPLGSSLIPVDSRNRPLFSHGQSFRLLFVTAGGRDAASASIGDYNLHVQNAAANNGALRPFLGMFRALASTAAVDARANTATTGVSMPVYWLGGAKVADDYADLYDGSWDARAGRTETGGSYTGKVWTGSNAGGTKATAPLGGGEGAQRGQAAFGDLGQTGKALASGSVQGIAGSIPLYALSPILVVVAPPIDGLAATPFKGKVELTWTVPASCVAPACKYQYRYRLWGGVWSAWAKAKAGTAVTVKKLSPGTKYEFAVRMVQGGVTKAEQTVAAATTGTPGSASGDHQPHRAAGARPGFTALGGHFRVILRWDDPNHAGIIKYQYRQKAQGGSYGAWTDMPNSNASTTEYTVTDVRKDSLGWTYVFMIRAVTLLGPGAPSDEASATTIWPDMKLVLGETVISENGGSTTVRAFLEEPSQADTKLVFSVSHPDRVQLSSDTLVIPAGETWSQTPITVTAIDNDVNNRRYQHVELKLTQVINPLGVKMPGISKKNVVVVDDD